MKRLVSKQLCHLYFVLQFVALHIPYTLAFPKQVTSNTIVLPVNEALITSTMGAYLSQYDTTVGAPSSAKIGLQEYPTESFL
jgi:hypothetical protein